MNNVLKDKWVWITGASSGIGAALAEALIKEEAKVILSARSIDKLQSIKESIAAQNKRCVVVPLDVTDSESIDTAWTQVKTLTNGVDFLINNAGISQRSTAEETDIEVDRKIMEVNFFGAVALTKLVLPEMLSNQKGHITVVSSIVGKFGFPLRTAYSASKHALQGYFESLRAEVSKQGIGVLIVSPGRIQTDISKHALKKDGTSYGNMDPGQSDGMSASLCAQKIIVAIKSGKRDVLIGRKELLMCYIRRFMPFLYHYMVGRINKV